MLKSRGPRAARRDLKEMKAIWVEGLERSQLQEEGRHTKSLQDPSSRAFPRESQGSQGKRRDPGAHT